MCIRDRAKLDRIETDILNNFKTLGVKTEPLSGYERLKVLHDVFNMDSNEPFRFSFDTVSYTHLKDKYEKRKRNRLFSV